MNVARRMKARDPRSDRAHRVGRRRAEQVPRQDRVGVAQARRADRDRARTRRVVPAAAAGRRAVGRRPGDREAAARARHRDGSSTCARPIPRCCAPPSAAWPTGCCSSRAARTTAPVEPNRPSKSSSSECTYAQDLVDLERIREEIAEMARENADVARATGARLARTVTIKVRYDDFTTITRSHTRAGHARRRRDRAARGRAARQDRRRPASRPAARRGRPQPRRPDSFEDDDDRLPLFHESAGD